MDGTETTAPAGEAGCVTQMLDTIWNEIVLGDSKLNPEKSCFELADEYRHSGKTAEECAENFIAWQTAKADSTGVVNLTKIVPVLDGLVGGGVNAVVTRQIGKTAIAWLREGPAAQGGGGPDAPAEGDIIEGEIA